MRRSLAALIDGPAWRTALLLAIFHLTLTLPRLGQPREYVFDEVYQAFTAGRYAAGDRDAYVWSTTAVGPSKYCAYEWIHPPVAKLVLAGSILILGDRPLGWRVPCALAGALLVALAYRVARRILPSRGAALLAGFALATDGMVLVMSRTGMSDVFVALFVLGAYGSFHGWLCARFPEDGAPSDPALARRRLYQTGLWLSLGIASKWFALLAWGFVGLCVGADAVRAAAQGVRAGRGLGALRGILDVGVALVAVPAAVYLASYAPFFAQGYSLGDFGELLRQEVYYHGHLTAKHDYASAWWKWPLLLRSVWLWTGTRDGVHRDIYILGNPALWWAGCLAMAGMALRWLRGLGAGRWRQHGAAVLLLGFFGQWLPWAIPARPAFLYYLLTALPFLAMAAAQGAVSLGERLGGRAQAAPVVAWTVLLAGCLVWLYPVLTGLPLGDAGWAHRLGFPGWR